MVLTHKIYIPITNTDHIMIMIAWCNRTLGNIGVDWDWDYDNDSDLNSDVNFYFRKESDMIFFKLRWL